MFHLVTNFSTTLKPQHNTDNRNRKLADLWLELKSTKSTTKTVGLTITELNEYLIRACVYQLHPSYTGPEIYDKFRQAQVWYKLDQHEQTFHQFTYLYFIIVIAKSKHDAKINSQKTQTDQ